MLVLGILFFYSLCDWKYEIEDSKIIILTNLYSTAEKVGFKNTNK